MSVHVVKIDQGERYSSGWVELFDTVFFYVYNLRHILFARGQSREMMERLTDNECFDRRIVLDYIPMLRRMAVHESAADCYAKPLETKQK
jgi:hypothetical protein